MLEYSRLGRKSQIEEIDSNKVIESILKDLDCAINNSKCKVIFAKLPTIKGYKTEFRLILQNLISNALKFKTPNKECIVKIEAENLNDFWQFSVIDNGIGIEEKYQEKIFTIFQRLHTEEQFEGSGIGLAHCKKIADLHEGKIWVESKVNEGSIFYFTISKNLN